MSMSIERHDISLGQIQSDILEYELDNSAECINIYNTVEGVVSRVLFVNLSIFFLCEQKQITHNSHSHNVRT